MKSLIKKILLLCTFLISSAILYSQEDLNKIQFIKGNISDKTVILRNTADDFWLCDTALDFVLQNKDLLKNDKEFEDFTVTAVGSVKPDYLVSDEEVQKDLLDKLNNIFVSLNTNAKIQSAVISKMLEFKELISLKSFTLLLNEYLNSYSGLLSGEVFTAVINALKEIGNNESFLIIYNLYINPKFESYKSQMTQTLDALIPVSVSEIHAIINNYPEQIGYVFDLIKKSSQIDTNSLCEIAENILNEAIILLENSSKNEPELITVQKETLNILADNLWTRASDIAISNFLTSKELYKKGLFSDTDFETSITCLNKISPIEAVYPLTKYLEELNGQTREGQNTASPVVLMAAIKTLGEIGDKTAFDSLLEVTYLNYPDNVVATARDSLSELRFGN